MYTIQTNASGTRSMEISEENLQTIEKYALLDVYKRQVTVTLNVTDYFRVSLTSRIKTERSFNHLVLQEMCIRDRASTPS